MTDNEIIKALECCSKGVTHIVCKGCPFDKTDNCENLEKYALDLINRQQADNERLKKLLEEADVNYNKCAKRFYKEAIKEYKEKLKEHAYLDSGITGFQEMVVDLSDIENIADGMVGEE